MTEHEKFAREEAEIARIMAAITRYEQADPEEVEEDEYQWLLTRYEELRRLGHGPQPYVLTDQ